MLAAMVFRTGEAARVDSHDNAPGFGAAYFGQLGVCCAVGAPIVVDGRLWGAAIVGLTQPGPLPPDYEAQVGDFADLVGTAIANAETRAQLTASRARRVAAADDARHRLERVCMTVLNSGWSPWAWNCAQRKRRCPLSCIR
jgi:GAF domain-containing protein